MHLIHASASSQIYLENLHHHLLIIGDVDCFKHFTVLATPKFSHQLKVILVSGREKKIHNQNVSLVEAFHAANVCKRVNKTFTPIQLRGTHSPSTPWADEC